MLKKIDINSTSDAEEFIKIRKESIINFPEFLMTYEEEEENYTAGWYVRWRFLQNYYFIIIDYKIVWYLKFSRLWNNLQWRHIYSIWPIYVSKTYQNKWIAFQSLKEMENIILSQKNFKFFLLKLEVSERNIAAIKLYHKLWYSFSWKLPKYIHTKNNEYIDVLVLYKILENV